MLDINWGDVLNILNLCKPYLIGLAVVFVLGIAAMIAVRKMEAAKRKLIRSESLIAILLALVIVVNMICFGPVENLLTLAFGDGSLSEETLEKAEESCLEIAEEGVVLLENKEQALPLKESSNLNVFGWASTNPCYGGTGSGALNDNYEKVTLLQGLESAGFSLNTEISDFYTEYREDHPEISPFMQDWTLPEPPADTYSDELLENAKEFSDTALIVLSRTGAEHADLPTDMTKIEEIWGDSQMFAAAYNDNSSEYEDFPEGKTYLDLSQSEMDMVDLVCKNFENVVVVLNGSNAMNLSFIREHEQIKGALWCAGPGQNGFHALGSVLNGTVNPSGRTPDTFVTDFSQTPYINNFGRFTYENMKEFTGDSWGDPTTPSFVNYVEGIYTGYKFYETAAKEGLNDYDELVQYPFGYGLSYTEFSKEMSDLKTEGDTVSFDVTVTNTGDTAGKDVVEIYYEPPYTNGGIEKASANLIDFEKTDLLEPGDSQTISFSFSQEDMASFDNKEAGCYVLEQGDYEISVNTDSHNKADSRKYTVDKTVTYNEENKRSSDETAAVTQLGYEEGDIEYLSRKDGFANYSTATAEPSYTLADEYKENFLNNDTYNPEDYNNADDEMPVTGAKNGLELKELRGAEFDDERWETLLDQMTVDEMKELIALGGFATVEAPSVGLVSTVDCDGPASINNNFTGVGSIGFPSGTMIACTWNKEMAKLFGEGIGEMADEMNVSGWYAPAMNCHRTPFGGRNFEYYSEDGVLSGYMAANAVIGAEEHGVYAYIKHYVLNDQEYNRQAMICTWSNEQATREIYLKPFEIAVKTGGADAVMSSYNYIGTTWAGACSGTLNGILRGEWGFNGMVLTDYNGNFNYMDADQAIRNGGDLCLINYDIGCNYLHDTASATSIRAMRQASKHIMYTIVNSRSYEDENLNAGMAVWKKAAIGIDVVLAAILIGLEVLTVRKYKKRKNAAETA